MTFKIDQGSTLHTSTDGMIFNPHVTSDKPGEWRPVSAIVSIEPMPKRPIPGKEQPAMSIKVLDWTGPVYLNGKLLMTEAKPQPQPIPVRVETETRPRWEFIFVAAENKMLLEYKPQDGEPVAVAERLTDTQAGGWMKCIDAIKKARRVFEPGRLARFTIGETEVKYASGSWTISRPHDSITTLIEYTAVLALNAALYGTWKDWENAKNADIPF